MRKQQKKTIYEGPTKDFLTPSHLDSLIEFFPEINPSFLSQTRDDYTAICYEKINQVNIIYHKEYDPDYLTVSLSGYALHAMENVERKILVWINQEKK